jgi:teichuronic acid biosynthesis glycosyltransferase TuaC
MSKGISVLLLSHMFPSPRDRRFGAFVYDQACALADLDVSLDVVSPVPMTPRLLALVNPKWMGYYQTPKHSTIGPFGVAYPRWVTLPRNVLFPSTGRWMARTLLTDETIVARLREADLIHAHAALPDGDCARVLAARLHKKYILTVHGSDILLFPSRTKATFDAARRERLWGLSHSGCRHTQRV